MTRRNVFTAGAALAAPLAAAAPKRSILDLRWFWMRNGNQAARTTDFLANTFVPAHKRLGGGTFGFFSAVIAEHSPFIVALLSFPSLAGLEEFGEALSADKDFQRGLAAYEAPSEPAYVRMETTFLRAFPSMPSIEVPAAAEGRAPRIFELRTYESHSQTASKRKVKMFDDAEIAIFRRCGMTPVFFGETIAGRNLPNLTYMLAFDDLAARDKAWRTFAADPEWLKLRATPGLTDPEIVSNISNAILRPLPFSQIR
jgi:hypothetical protein